MDNIHLELYSEVKLKDCLLKTQQLIPNINTNDKTPSWDGDIIIYSSDKICNDNILGKVDIQLKGTYKEDLSKSEITFRMKKVDLRNYKLNGGIILFVVYIKSPDEYKIFYQPLLPFTLNKLLNKPRKKKTASVNITLWEFPENDTQEIINIFLNFAKDKKLQFSTVEADNISIRDVCEQKSLYEGLMFDIVGKYKNNWEVISYLFRNPTYLYTKPKNINISIPVASVQLKAITQNDVATSVKLNDVEYYDKISIEVDKQFGEKWKIGKSFEYIPKEGTLHFRLRGSLKERIRAIQFVLYLDGSRLTIGDIDLGVSKEQFKDEELNDFRRILVMLLRVQEMLDKFGVHEELNYDDLTEKQEQELLRYTDAIIDNKPLVFQNDVDIGLFGKKTFANVSIAFLFKPIGKHQYQLENFFDSREISIYHSQLYQDGHKEKILISRYLALGASHIIAVSNMDWEKVLEDIKSIEWTPLYGELITEFILDALNIYDEYGDSQILIYLLELLNWMLEYTDEPIISILNKLQVTKRLRQLNNDEVNYLIELRKIEHDFSVLAGISILLENNIEAEFYLSKLSVEEKSRFKNYPIYSLMKDIKRNT